MLKNTTTLQLNGLDCASCALKIEQAVRKIEGVSTASLDFTTQKLRLELDHSLNQAQIIELVTAETQRLEPDLHILIENQSELKPKRHGDIKTLRLVLGVALFGIGLSFSFDPLIKISLYGLSYFLVGSDVLLKAVRNSLHGEVFDENFLMSIATIGAFAIGQYPEGVAVMLFYKIGEFFQDRVLDHSRQSIIKLMDIRPDSATVYQGDDYIKMSPQDVAVGDVILIKPGEKVPLDGIVLEGYSLLDTASLTGEAIPREISINQAIYSGTINKTGVLKVKVTKTFGDSTVSKILDLVENASSKKAPTEQFITKFARFYTPVVVAIALALALIPPLIIRGAHFEVWIYRALVFLVVSCPCALVISIPLGYFGGIGSASKQGILMKGSNYLEALKTVDTMVFDKTGTLTTGQFTVTKIVTLSKYSEKEILQAAALAESYSLHPIAVSILKAHGPIDQSQVLSAQEFSGLGLKVETQNESILAGNEKYMNQNGFKLKIDDQFGTLIHIAINGVYAGYVVTEDELKPDAKATIRALESLGVSKIVMLTGDSENVGRKIASELGIEEVYSKLMPNDKVEKVEWLENHKLTKGKLVFVGDGINDAPVLTRADVGIAMGALGSDAAIEAADVVLMTDEPSKIITAIHLSRFTQKIVWENIIIALAVKGAVLSLGALGLATMWEAVFADVGVALLAVFNALRILHYKPAVTV